MLLNYGAGEDSWECLDFKDMKPVNPKEINLEYVGRTDTRPEALILWPPDVKSKVIGEDPDAGKIWRQKEKGVTEDEMVRASPIQWPWFE